MQEISVYTDGASRGNPGAAAIAYTISGIGAEAIELYKAIGTTTNNQAEYQALVAALQELTTQTITDATINFFADSELMIKQVRGEYRVKDVNLQPHHRTILSLSHQLETAGNTLTFTAVRREQNKRADYLANCALDNTTP